MPPPCAASRAVYKRVLVSFRTSEDDIERLFIANVLRQRGERPRLHDGVRLLLPSADVAVSLRRLTGRIGIVHGLPALRQIHLRGRVVDRHAVTGQFVGCNVQHIVYHFSVHYRHPYQ